MQIKKDKNKNKQLLDKKVLRDRDELYSKRYQCDPMADNKLSASILRLSAGRKNKNRNEFSAR